MMLIGSTCTGQSSEYAQPLDGKLILAGSFGEIRSNHFHSGLDIKTDGREMKPVHAIADGIVSRILVSPVGFGKAIYIDHPNGKTSVYAHLRSFSDELARFVKEQQYRQQRFSVDLNVPAGKFHVSKGETIALSGTSGSSGGPHLHFEIRETKDQIPENPLNFGFAVKDDRFPQMQKLWLYSHSPHGNVQGDPMESGIALIGQNGHYALKDTANLTAFGMVSFGIGAYDRFSDAHNVCGIYSMTVEVDDVVIHRQVIDRFPFSKKRMVNTDIDYSKRASAHQNVYRSYKSPGNKLDIYPEIKNGGMIQVEEGEHYRVHVQVSDHAGNVSELNFSLIGKNGNVQQKKKTEPTGTFYPERPNGFANNALRLNIPQGCLYDTLAFYYSEKPRCKSCIAPIQSIGSLSDTPLDNYMTVSIRLDTISGLKHSKALIVSFDAKGKPVAEGGSVKWNWITTQTRSFGNYSVMLDMLMPELRPLNFTDQSYTSKTDTLKFFLKDDLSGIASYTGMLNGSWALFEWAPKNNLIYYVKDQRFKKGLNTLSLTVTDKVGNMNSLKLTVQ